MIMGERETGSRGSIIDIIVVGYTVVPTIRHSINVALSLNVALCKLTGEMQCTVMLCMV